MAHPAPLELSSCCKHLLAREGRARAGAHSGAVLPDRMWEVTEHRGRLRFPNFCLPRRCEFHGLSIPYLNFVVQVGGLQVQNPHTQNYIPAVPIVSEMSFADEAEFTHFM